MKSSENIAPNVENKAISLDRRICVAPMMDWTDRHCRYFLRGYSPDVLLYTEMITAEALLRGDAARLLRFHPEEHPVALQLGGSDPGRLEMAARLGVDAGYDEINLNCGCPSDRVHAGAFGACLMNAPETVAQCVTAMRRAVMVPVTVKMRIGVLEGGGAGMRERMQLFDERDRDALYGFVRQVAGAGCTRIIVHARKAVLGGLSPADNRSVPPLRRDVVRQLQVDFPGLEVVLNGGLRTAAESLAALQWADGVMLGREAYHRPEVLAELQRALVDAAWQTPSVAALLERMAHYAANELQSGESVHHIVRHMLGMLSGRSGAKEFRRFLSEGARAPAAGAGLFLAAAARFS
jgi:tRNA-dihydrouridine synthase A